jgi:hypothetical protein
VEEKIGKEIEKVVGAPADVLEKTVQFSEGLAKNKNVKKKTFFTFLKAKFYCNKNLI